MRAFPPFHGILLLPIALLAGCAGRDERLRAVLVHARDLPGARSLSSIKSEGFNAVVAVWDEASPTGDIDRLRASASQAGIPLYLWIDVGRSPRLAAERPELVAGMGMHEDWRSRFPGAPKPKEGERIGIHPWTPIWYRAVLEDRRAAIARLLRGRTGGIAGVFLNQIQGAPSACGCGNDQCRWTVDYRMPGGPEKVEGSPAAILIAALRKELPEVAWIPVWVTECEEEDQAPRGTGYCGTVHCWSGLCWKESTRELEPLAREVEGPVAVLAAHRLFRRHPGVYDPPGGWPGRALELLATVPPTYGHPPLPARRLIAVVEDEGLSPEEKKILERTLPSGARGTVHSRIAFNEGWEPRIVPAAKGGAAPPGPARH